MLDFTAINQFIIQINSMLDFTAINSMLNLTAINDMGNVIIIRKQLS
jgi:hypothetical protein